MSSASASSAAGFQLDDPSVWFSSFVVPDLFSFAAVEDIGYATLPPDEFDACREQLNHLAAGKPILPADVDSLVAKLKSSYDSLRDMQHLSPAARRHLIRLCVALARLARLKNIFFVDLYDIVAYNAEAEAHFGELAAVDYTTDVLWLYANSLHDEMSRLSDSYPTLIERTLFCLESMGSDVSCRRHRLALARYVRDEYYDRMAERGLHYPKYGPLERLERAFPEHPWRLDGHCALARHSFIKSKLTNRENYFDLMDSLLLLPTDDEQKEHSHPLRLDISAAGSVLGVVRAPACTFSQHLLFKFAAHICPLSWPILSLRIRNVSDLPDVAMDNAVRQHLRACGLCNSEGWLDVRKIKKDYINFAVQTAGAAVHFLKRKNRAPRRSTKQWNEIEIRLIQQLVDGSLRNDIEEQLRSTVVCHARLSGLPGLSALLLFHAALQPFQHGLPQRKLDKIRALLVDCIELQHAVSAVMATNDSLPQKHNAWWKQAGTIVDSLIQRPRSLLLQVGTPIRENEKYSNHALFSSTTRSKTCTAL
jgi:hypothetical protein